MDRLDDDRDQSHRDHADHGRPGQSGRAGGPRGLIATTRGNEARTHSCGAAALLCVSLVALAGTGCDRDAATAPPTHHALVLPADLVYERIVNGNQDLYVLPADGGPERRLTDHPATDGLPRWTRDGRAVLFASDRTGNWQLWEVPAEGGAAQRVRSNGSVDWQADVSPDGRRLALLSRSDGPEALWILERGSGAGRALVRHGKSPHGRNAILGNPHWSPDGRDIVFSSNHEFGHQIYVVDVATGEQTRVSPLTSGGCEPRFSPDGRKVAYVSRRLWRVKSRLVEHDLATREERVLVEWPALNYDPVYSPDGTELAFASNIDGQYAIYRQRLLDGKAWRVTFGSSPARYPDYRPAR